MKGWIASLEQRAWNVRLKKTTHCSHSDALRLLWTRILGQGLQARILGYPDKDRFRAYKPADVEFMHLGCSWIERCRMRRCRLQVYQAPRKWSRSAGRPCHAPCNAKGGKGGEALQYLAMDFVGSPANSESARITKCAFGKKKCTHCMAVVAASPDNRSRDETINKLHSCLPRDVALAAVPLLTTTLLPPRRS